MFGGKRGCLQAEDHHPNREARERQDHVVCVCVCLVANGSSKWTMTTSILPKLWQNGLRTTKSRYWSGHHKAMRIYREFVGRTEKECASKEANKPDSVTLALSGGMGQNSPNLLWDACGRLPEIFDPSKTI